MHLSCGLFLLSIFNLVTPFFFRCLQDNARLISVDHSDIIAVVESLSDGYSAHIWNGWSRVATSNSILSFRYVIKYSELLRFLHAYPSIQPEIQTLLLTANTFVHHIFTLFMMSGQKDNSMYACCTKSGTFALAGLL